MIQEMQEEALTSFAWYDQYRRNTTQALFAFLTGKGFWKNAYVNWGHRPCLWITAQGGQVRKVSWAPKIWSWGQKLHMPLIMSDRWNKNVMALTIISSDGG